MTVSKPKSLILCGAFVAAMVASVVTPSYAMFDKTRFVIHLGVAYFAFHHWVLKPFNEGAFTTGSPQSRIVPIAKGGAALIFAYHEVKVADRIAKKSNSPLLQKLEGALTGLETQFSTVGAKLKGGHFDPADITSLSSATDALKGNAASSGVNIKDVSVPSLPTSDAAAAAAADK
jgi:hypothetical protein